MGGKKKRKGIIFFSNLKEKVKKRTESLREIKCSEKSKAAFVI